MLLGLVAAALDLLHQLGHSALILFVPTGGFLPSSFNELHILFEEMGLFLQGFLQSLVLFL